MSAVLALQVERDVLEKVDAIKDLKQNGDVGDTRFFKCPFCKTYSGAVKVDGGKVFASCGKQDGCFEFTL
jgi:hypothetical protein